MTEPAPATAEALRAAILASYPQLSKRLQQVARYALDEPNEMGIETLAVIAERSGVQPSTIVRFAKTFGFDGASQMQRLFRDGLLASQAALGYAERVRGFSQEVDERTRQGDGGLLAEFVEGNSLALQTLAQTVTDADLAEAVRLLEAASTVYVVGFRRSFAVASYLAYSLQQTGKKTAFVTGVGGMTEQQVKTIAADDLLIAVSYQPYASEAVEAVELARERGARILTISDSLVSPIAAPATLTLQVRETEIRAFRSLAASMCLAQALVIGYAFEVTRKQEQALPRRGRGRDK